MALLAIGAAIAAPAIAQPSSTRTPPPNIVLIIADDLGYGDLGSYGHHTIKTPAIDALARDGLRFTSFYASSPLCSPSRAGLLTGRVPFRTGIESWIPPDTDVELGPREVTLAAILKHRGYQTFLSGKWHLNGGLDVKAHTQPGDHGFDRWLAFHGWAIPSHRDPTNFFRDGKPVGEIKGYAAQIVADEAIGYLETRRAGQPFFLYLSFAEPHSTIASPDWFNALYSGFTTGTPDPMPNENRPPANMAARGPGEYYANVTHMDYQVGRFLLALDRLGLRENTIVVFTSDNGAVTTDWRHWYEVNLYGSTGGFRGRKAELYEGGIRVPGIIRWPGHVASGRETDAPVINCDLLPTLAAISGAILPSGRPIDGEDISAVLRGERFSRARPMYWEFEDQQGFHYALRDGDWKLLADRTLTRVRLYNLARERFEITDRALEAPETAKAMLERLRAMRADVERDPLRPRAAAAR